MPFRLSACSSLSQSGGKAGRLARTVLGIAGLSEAGGKLPDQLATRQLSWCGSINCKELPTPFAPEGQGAPLLKRTDATTRLAAELAPGCTNRRVCPEADSRSAKVSKMWLV